MVAFYLQYMSRCVEPVYPLCIRYEIRSQKLHEKSEIRHPALRLFTHVHHRYNLMPRSVQWPNNTTTIPFAKNILSSTIRPFDVDSADAVLDEKNFRNNYNTHFINHVRIGATSANAAITMAQKGLDIIYDSFQFDNDQLLKDAMNFPILNKFQRVTYYGNKRNTTTTTTTTTDDDDDDDDNVPAQSIRVPYGGEMLEGPALAEHVDSWVRRGTIDPSAGEAIHSLLLGKDKWTQEILDTHAFVVMGAGAAMGPAGKEEKSENFLDCFFCF